MSSPSLANGSWLHSLILWWPPLIAGLGFLLGLTFYGPGTILLVWGVSWFLAYLILFLEFRRTRRAFGRNRPASRWLSGQGLAVASVILVVAGLVLFLGWILTPAAICGGGAGSFCLYQPSGASLTFGILTPLETLEVLYLLLLAGFVSLTLSSRLLARAQRRAGLPLVDVPTPRSPAQST
jgi:hypothetical protein